MDAYVIDTHVWIWQMFHPSKLGTAAREVLLAADCGSAHVHIPAVVLAEFLMIANKRRVANLTPDIVPKVISAINAHPGYSFSALTPELVLASQGYRAVPEVFDRLIVTEAGMRNLPLLTRDPEIQAAGLVRIVWD